MNSSWLCCATCELLKTAVPWAQALTAQLSAGAAVQVHCRLLISCPRVMQGLQKQCHCPMAFQEQTGQLLWAQLALISGSIISPAAESKMRNTVVWGGSCWHHLTPVFCQSHLQFCRVSCLLLSYCCCWHPASIKPFPWDALRLLTALLPRSASYQTAAPAPTSASPS